MDGTPYVETLEAASPDPARLGGKGASLARLVRLGYLVPKGFVVTVDAFMATIDRLGLSRALEELSRALIEGTGSSGAVERIRQGLGERRVPAEVLDPILEALDRLHLWRNPDGLIVRSSATAEDSDELSFAGIFESISINAPAELEPAMRNVWLSGLSPRAIAYVRDRGLIRLPLVALVVQPFLAAERSGVMFTRFRGPDGMSRILVEHVEGACEKLVKGEVTPDRLWLTVPDQVPDDLEGTLAPIHARELARLAAKLEETFGTPQDVEWVIHDGRVHVVQSRPITTGIAAPVRGAGGPIGAAVAPMLTGTGASPGSGSGQVRLVFNVEHALELESGEILVTPMTNPDMVVAMRNAAAIVTDVGGMICHAAIVSRELGLPCVVGTERATSILSAEQAVTVDGWIGAVYDGLHAVDRRGGPARPLEWDDVWSIWKEATRERDDLVPILPALAALEAMPPGTETVVLIPDVDLRSDSGGLWRDLEGLPAGDRTKALDRYVERVSAAASGASPAIFLLPIGSLSRPDLAAALERGGDARISMHRDDDPRIPVLTLDPGSRWPRGPAAVPLTSAALVHSGTSRAVSGPGPIGEAIEAAVDTLTFFGHRPGVKVAGMPDPDIRKRWWAILPEYARFHQEFGTAREGGAFEWLEVRPELVISPLLKSLVQPGFEMVPRILGFRDLGPMHIKWIRCRYHFRADAFATVWEAIVRATWDEMFMADLMRKVRASYRHLEEVVRLFPKSNQELAVISGDRMVALVTAWWPRWVEFFSLCWFIQAQGDDVAYPFIEQTVAHNLSRLGSPPAGLTWPTAQDLVAPTTPVMSGEYMADVGRLREALLAAGLDSRQRAEQALGRGEQPDLAAMIEVHLRRWHWMRDRDLLFEPWDTTARVIETALATEPHAPSPYRDNLRRNLLVLGFHLDLAQGTGRAEALNRMTRFLHDLNVERENHHVLWLKYSYPLRRLVLELERRWVGLGSLEPGDVFFLQAPELLEGARRLPAALPRDLAATVQNRRRGFLLEAKLIPHDGAPARDEDDYL
jgi:phosphohistidine swiveling domain-containing protein